MKDWKGFLKKHFKQLIVVLLAIVIVVSYSLSRSSDRTLRAGGFPGEEQTEPGRDTESGEDSPDAAATAAAPLELVLDEPEETGEETPEESPGENTPEQEGESEQDLTAPEESVEEGPSGEEEEPASGGQEESASDGQDDAGSGGQDESVSGGQDASVSGGESFVSGEDEDTAESVHADEAHDTDAGEAHGTGADEASANAEGSGANDGTDAGEASREAFFTTEDEGSAQDSGRESSEGESRETFFTTEDEDPAQDREDPTVFAMGGEDGDDASAAKTGREQTVFTMEDEAADDASAGKTGDAAEAADKASTGKTGDAAEAADKASTGRTGDAAGAGKTGSTAEAAEKDVRPAGVADTLVFKGPDYTVTATYGADAGIPAGASLVVFEIKEEEKAYQAYCDQAQAAVADSLAGGSGAGQGGSAQAEGSGAGSKAGTADSSTGTGTGSTESGDASKNASGEKGNNASSAEQAGTEAKSGRADAGNTGTASASAGSTGTTAAAAAGDKDVTVSWVRLFDITIEVDGKAVEPQGPVAVQIDYGQGIEQAWDEEVNTVHFEGREEVPVVLDTQTEGSGETLEQVNFETSGFSVFVVMGTKITKRILASDGVGYLITLTCGPEAAVPADAELEVREIISGTDEYEDYLAKAKDAIREENLVPARDTGPETDSEAGEDSAADTDSGTGEDDAADTFGISFARFFDIRIVAGGKTIEPAAPVQVTVAYADALDMEDEDTLCAVHFAKSGTQVIQASPDEDQKAVTFVQDSFSVTGTVVTNSGVWPASGSTSVMYVKSGNDYYAVAHDGGLHQVWLSGSSLIFPDDAEGFDISRYEWTYEQQRSYGWANHYLFYTDSRGARQYLDPSAPGGISSNAVSLSRDNSGKIYYKPNYGTSSYIGTGGDSLAGGQSSSQGAVIQFASDFSLPRKVTIHFVDRDGNALSGVSYQGPENYPVIQNDDGTFALPYEWNLGNASLTLHLDKDFSRDGYTYASTHLAGIREGTALTYDGLTMDAALTERGNNLYYYADAGQSLAYGSLTERKLEDALQVPNAAGTGMTDYLASKVDKDIYVILDPVPTYSPAQTSEGLDIEDPEFSKTLADNEDGTYTLSLNVTGRGINASTNPKANVIFVVDTSSSMDKTEGTGTGYSRLHDTKPALKTLASDLLLSN